MACSSDSGLCFAAFLSSFRRLFLASPRAGTDLASPSSSSLGTGAKREAELIGGAAPCGRAPCRLPARTCRAPCRPCEDDPCAPSATACSQEAALLHGLEFSIESDQQLVEIGGAAAISQHGHDLRFQRIGVAAAQFAQQLGREVG